MREEWKEGEGGWGGERRCLQHMRLLLHVLIVQMRYLGGEGGDGEEGI